MLLRFRVANVLSLRDEHELSFVATQYNQGNAVDTGLVSESRAVHAVPVLGIYGANASGKSNVLLALRHMQQAVLQSHAQWTQGTGVPRQPFTFDLKAREDTSFFEVDLVLTDGVRYTYGFELSDERVEAEWLHAYPHGRRQVWFERDTDATELFRFPGDHLKGPRTTLAKLTRDNALFLATAAANNQPQLSAIYRWFADNLWLVTPERDRVPREEFTRKKMLGPMREQVEQLLRAADLGVERIDVVRKDPDPPEVRLVHASDAGEVALEFEHESLGTRTWFALLGPLLLALEQGSVLLVDELDASLHPTLMAEVVRLFHDLDANEHGAQLVFTTHDTTLLGSPPGGRPLDRGQVWLTEKARDGATELYPLVDARPRNDENLERSYLRGRYGGIPQVGPGQIVRQTELAICAESGS